jgi:5-hydroxyisourate hydrolase
MSPITTHVLDTARGRPAEGITVVLEYRASEGSWMELAHGQTNADGRLTSLLPDDATLSIGTYRLRFATGEYHASLGVRGFYPEIPILFQIDEAGSHYHVPLLLCPFGYSTYRGT